MAWYTHSPHTHKRVKLKMRVGVVVDTAYLKLVLTAPSIRLTVVYLSSYRRFFETTKIAQSQSDLPSSGLRSVLAAKSRLTADVQKPTADYYLDSSPPVPFDIITA